MNRLKELRQDRGLTQEELARLARTSQPTIYKLEAGKRSMSRKWATRLAPHLGVRPEELIFGEDVPASMKPKAATHTSEPPSSLVIAGGKALTDAQVQLIQLVVSAKPEVADLLLKNAELMLSAFEQGALDRNSEADSSS